ncbi:phosphatidylglycerophosphatase A [Roseomonas sp. BN140053]|uniref:phosphatidylglycerophosphatase A family protein n=1 Tax=Roseomonas sp. BN140053 TaxID=3391898 RepID=UPI0039E7A0DF
MTPAALVATLGGIGRLRPAPGTWGSAVVLPLAWLGPLPCLVLAALLAVAGTWAVSRLPEATQDPGWVVVDEGAGQCLVLAALPALPGGLAGLGWVLLGFALFRLFDVLKPWPVSWADRRSGAAWVMLDDLLAGALGALAVLLLRSFA